MNPSLTLFLLIALCACNKSGGGSSTTTSSASGETPYYWASFSSAKILEVSEDFTVQEIANIEDMAEAWNESVEGDKIFFDFGPEASEISNSGEIDGLLDDTLGIYKTLNWPSSLPSSALAVTQIFGVRKNVGKSGEFIDIQHADILVNYDDYDFDTGDSGSNYDLRTVLLHEMGHFLGLQHKSTNSNRNSSIMYPSISSSENKRAPLAVDIEDIRELYGLSDSGSTPALMTEKNTESSDEGIPVKIIIELHANGECVHHVDDKIQFRHQHEIKLLK
jgi:hypothetical protein